MHVSVSQLIQLGEVDGQSSQTFVCDSSRVAPALRKYVVRKRRHPNLQLRIHQISRLCEPTAAKPAFDWGGDARWRAVCPLAARPAGSAAATLTCSAVPLSFLCHRLVLFYVHVFVCFGPVLSLRCFALHGPLFVLPRPALPILFCPRCWTRTFLLRALSFPCSASPASLS